MYKVIQIWPGPFVCKSGDISPGHIWTTLYVLIFSRTFKLCIQLDNKRHDKFLLSQPLQPIRWLLRWAFSHMVWFAMQMDLFPSWVVASDDGKYRHINIFSVWFNRVDVCVVWGTMWLPIDILLFRMIMCQEAENTKNSSTQSYWF